jgi:hypothetical protein
MTACCMKTWRHEQWSMSQSFLKRTSMKHLSSEGPVKMASTTVTLAVRSSGHLSRYFHMQRVKILVLSLAYSRVLASQSGERTGLSLNTKISPNLTSRRRLQPRLLDSGATRLLLCRRFKVGCARLQRQSGAASRLRNSV